jgi:hypothetical protein
MSIRDCCIDESESMGTLLVENLVAKMMADGVVYVC